MEQLHRYTIELTSTGLLLLVAVVVRFVSERLIRRYSKLSHILEHRANLVIKYISILLFVLVVIGIFAIWSIKTDMIFTTLSAVVTVIGVALFAQWSILSNITSGIILLFSFPFKIGDIISIHDKDFPIVAEIEDIRAFHTLLRTKEGERISYPNNLLLQKGVSILKEFREEKEFTD